MKSEIAAQSLEDSWKTLESFEKNVAEMRSDKPRQSEDDEIYFDRLALGLKDIPRQKMSQEECISLEAKMIAENDPQSTPENRNPALIKVLEVLETLCSKVKP